MDYQFTISFDIWLKLMWIDNRITIARNVTTNNDNNIAINNKHMIVRKQKDYQYSYKQQAHDNNKAINNKHMIIRKQKDPLLWSMCWSVHCCKKSLR